MRKYRQFFAIVLLLFSSYLNFSAATSSPGKVRFSNVVPSGHNTQSFFLSRPVLVRNTWPSRVPTGGNSVLNFGQAPLQVDKVSKVEQNPEPISQTKEEQEETILLNACDERHDQLKANDDKQFQAYLAGVEAITLMIEDLDDAVTRLKPSSTKSTLKPSTTVASSSSWSEQWPPAYAGSLSTTEDNSDVTTESFTDPPIDNSERWRRESTEGPYFGIPLTRTTPVPSDQAIEDLSKASSDLKSLRRDLNSAAERLKQTNNSVHSVMLRALQAYVTSIERRVEHQRQLYAQTKATGLKAKVAVIQEKISILMDKLKSLVSLEQQGAAISRVDHASTTVATLVPNGRVSVA